MQSGTYRYWYCVVEYISILVLCSLVHIDTGTVQSGTYRYWYCAVEYISVLVLCSLVHIDTGTVQSGRDWHCLVKLGTDGISWYSLFVCTFWWVGSGQPHGNWEWTYLEQFFTTAILRFSA